MDISFHNVINNTFINPRDTFTQHWFIDWNNYNEREFIETFYYWIGSLSDITDTTAIFTNLKNKQKIRLIHNQKLVEGNCLIYLPEVIDGYAELKWYRHVSDPVKFSKGDTLLRHLYLLWHNSCLPKFKPVPSPLTKHELHLINNKRWSIGKTSMNRGYELQDWPSFGSTEWYDKQLLLSKPRQTYPKQEVRTSPIIKFDN